MLAAFFMPWTQFFGLGISGYSLGQLGSYGNYAWIIPIAAGITILITFLEINNRGMGLVAGIIPLGAIFYGLIRISAETGGGEAAKNILQIAGHILSIGAWLTIIFSTGMVVASFVGKGSTETESHNYYEPNPAMGDRPTPSESEPTITTLTSPAGMQLASPTEVKSPDLPIVSQTSETSTSVPPIQPNSLETSSKSTRSKSRILYGGVTAIAVIGLMSSAYVYHMKTLKDAEQAAQRLVTAEQERVRKEAELAREKAEQIARLEAHNRALAEEQRQQAEARQQREALAEQERTILAEQQQQQQLQLQRQQEQLQQMQQQQQQRLQQAADSSGKIRLTVTNRNCGIEGFFLDGRRIGIISPNSTSAFIIEPRRYRVEICNPNNPNQCASPVAVDYSSGPASFIISRHPNCQ